MSALSIQPTYPIFTETDGLPLENGYIWIGAANLDPQGNPINVYWDAALTIAAPQPIRTLNGYPSRNGTPARLYVNSDYSIRVQNSKGSLVYSAPQATERYGNIITASDISFTGFKGQAGTVADLADADGSGWIGFLQSGAGAVAESVQDKLTQIVNVKDFGAVGDGITDDTVAFQNAIDYVYSIGGGTVFNPYHVRVSPISAGNVCLQVRDNVFIDNTGGTIEIIPNALTLYAIVMFRDDVVTGAGIFGGKIIGDKTTHLGVTGEFGMGVWTAGATYVSIEDIEISNCWGDGIYLGANQQDLPRTATGTAYINNVICDGNRRQGISVVEADKVVIPYAVLKNTSGTAPAAGIDIEPNANGGVGEVIFGTLICDGNQGCGLLATAPFQPATIARIVGDTLIVRNNLESGASIEGTEYCQINSVIATSNTQAGFTFVRPGTSNLQIGSIESIDNNSATSVRSAAVNIRCDGDNPQYIGSIFVTGGAPKGGAVRIVSGAFTAGSISIKDVDSDGTYSAYSLVIDTSNGGYVKLGDVGIRDCQQGGVICSAEGLNIRSLTLSNLNTLDLDDRRGVYNTRPRAIICNVLAYDGTNVKHIVENTSASSRCIVNGLVASTSALRPGEAGASVLVNAGVFNLSDNVITS